MMYFSYKEVLRKKTESHHAKARLQGLDKMLNFLNFNFISFTSEEFALFQQIHVYESNCSPGF